MDERSSDQIQRDIERTRGAMSETIDALERRLSPGEIIDELWGRMKGGQTGSNVGETIRDHPVPLALMGLGLGWLAIEKATESRTQQLRDRYGDAGEGTYARAEGRVGPYRGDDVIDPEFRYGSSDGIGSRIGNTAENVKDRATSVGSGLKDRVTEMSGDIRDGFSSATDAARDRMSDMGERMHRSAGQGNMGDGGPGMGERAHHLRERASGELGHARETMRRRGNQLESTFRSLLDDYPLALGAVTFGLGLAAGASAPTTRREDELMGHAADTLRDEVKDVAKETTQRARTVAGQAARAAQNEARNEGMGDDLKSKAERVVQAATSTARQEAESQGLTAEAMKERGREIGKHAAESAREGSSGAPTQSDTGGRGLHGSSFGQSGSTGSSSGASAARHGPTSSGGSTLHSSPVSAGRPGGSGPDTTGMGGPGRTGSSTGSTTAPGGSATSGSDTANFGRTTGGSSGGLSSPTSNRPTGGTGDDRFTDRDDNR